MLTDFAWSRRRLPHVMKSSIDEVIMKPRTFFLPAILMLAVLLGGCASNHLPAAYPGDYPARPVSTYPGPAYTRDIGIVESIRLVEDNPQQAVGAGAVIGGVVGGLLGNQVGGGSGRKAATVAGAVGGALLGHRLERRQAPRAIYHVGVRMHDGRYLTIAQEDVRDLRIGGQVRLENQRLYPA
jgi:outer membrane lipoprotein SlyB